MDFISFQQQIQSLHSDIIKYRKMIDKYTKLIYFNKANPSTLSYAELMRREEQAQRQLKLVRQEVVKLENKYYAQFPLTQAQLECVGFPTGVTNLDGSDRF